jgi:DGQHR domain-containing protein
MQEQDIAGNVPNLSEQVGGNIQIFRDNVSLDAAFTRAARENGVAGGMVIPITLFRQGTRWLLQGVLPIASIVRSFESHPATKAASLADVEKAINRPLMEDHVRGISTYLVENAGSRYILPGLSVNIQTVRPLRFYTTDSQEAIVFGYLFLPNSARFSLTDGQHRIFGAKDAMEKMLQVIRDHFSEDGVPVMISLENDVRQVHQDFADCSRVRPLPPALLATYDRRNPGNRMFLDLIDKTAIFRDKVESASKSISKTSPNLFTANQIKSYVKALLLRSWSGSVEQYEADVRDLIANQEQQDAKVAELVTFTEALTEAIPVWKQITSIPPEKKNQIIDIRAGRYVCLEGEGLVILGYIGYELLNYAPDGWREYVKRLGSINWRESELMWTSSLRQPVQKADSKTGQAVVSYRKLSSYAAVSAAIDKVREAIGWVRPDALTPSAPPPTDAPFTPSPTGELSQAGESAPLQ